MLLIFSFAVSYFRGLPGYSLFFGKLHFSVHVAAVTCGFLHFAAVVRPLFKIKNTIHPFTPFWTRARKKQSNIEDKHATKKKEQYPRCGFNVPRRCSVSEGRSADLQFRRLAMAVKNAGGMGFFLEEVLFDAGDFVACQQII